MTLQPGARVVRHQARQRDTVGVVVTPAGRLPNGLLCVRWPDGQGYARANELVVAPRD